MSRHIVQIAAAATPDTPGAPQTCLVYALCNDGTVWEGCALNMSGFWTQCQPIPQEDSHDLPR